MALGAQVVIAARRLDVLEQAAVELNKESGKAGGRVHVCQCNVRSEEAIQKLVGFALEKMGRIDGLVNNAGGQFVSPVENISARGFKAVVETNLLSCFMLSKEVYNQWYGRRVGGEEGREGGTEGGREGGGREGGREDRGKGEAIEMQMLEGHFFRCLSAFLPPSFPLSFSLSLPYFNNQKARELTPIIFPHSLSPPPSLLAPSGGVSKRAAAAAAPSSTSSSPTRTASP